MRILGDKKELSKGKCGWTKSQRRGSVPGPSWMNMQHSCMQDGYFCSAVEEGSLHSSLGQSKFLVSCQLISPALRRVDHGVYIFPISSWVCLESGIWSLYLRSLMGRGLGSYQDKPGSPAVLLFHLAIHDCQGGRKTSGLKSGDLASGPRCVTVGSSVISRP